MPCNCHKPASLSTADKAAMCQTCPRSIKSAAGSAITCTVLGRPIVEVVTIGMPCPTGRHPDADGVVRWAGVRWFGVPEPLRWAIVWALGREPRGLSGCGCIAAVKESRLGPIIEPWAEGISTLRRRFADALSEWQGRQPWDEHHAS